MYDGNPDTVTTQILFPVVNRVVVGSDLMMFQNTSHNPQPIISYVGSLISCMCIGTRRQEWVCLVFVVVNEILTVYINYLSL